MARRNDEVPEDAPVFVISVAAQLAGMHAQTLRTYDRQGLVSPGRTSGGGRRYSMRDIALLREVQRLSQEDGVNLAGIKRIIELENQVDALRARGKGVVRKEGQSGDLIVTVEVQIPSGVSGEARDALESFAKLTPPAGRERLEARLRKAG